MRLVVMVGAGASCAGPGVVGPIRSNTELEPGNPPLGAHLLRELSRAYPDEWNSDTISLFGRDPSNFEEGMMAMFESLWSKGSSDQKKRFAYCVYRMAEYFANWRVSDGSTLYSSMVDQLLMADLLKAKGQNPDISFVSLNYERLLETAILARNIFVVHRSRVSDQHVNSVPVWKPHGSCNFLAAAYAGTTGYPSAEQLSGKIKVLDNARLGVYLEMIGNALDTQRSQQVLIAMSLYMRNKPTMVGRGDIESIRQSYIHDVSSSEVLVMVGVRPVATDNHLFDPILSRSGPTLFVGGDDEDFRSFTRKCRGDVTLAARTFQEALEKRIFDLR